jgi:hypothetical protein
MIAAIAKADQDGLPILDSHSWSSITDNQFRCMLTGNVVIPRFDSRLNIFRELGTQLQASFNGNIQRLLSQGNYDALSITDTIIATFKSFDDSAVYRGVPVHFRKRAQLFVSDVARTIDDDSLGRIKHTDKLTAAADYKLPWILRRLGILRYDPSLAARIDRRLLLKPSSEEEIEIRACTIWAVQYIVEQLHRRLPSLCAIDVNDVLWLMSQAHKPNDEPYHLCDTTAY